MFMSGERRPGGTRPWRVGRDDLEIEAAHPALRAGAQRPAKPVRPGARRAGGRLGAELGLSRRLALGAVLPRRLVNTAIRYLDAATGDEATRVTPETHHR